MIDYTLELPTWFQQGDCVGLDVNIFFPQRGQSPRPAKAICKECPIRVPCLNWAMENDERIGIWGGTTGKDRRKMRAQRRNHESS